MNEDSIEQVASELVGEGYHIVWDDGTLSPAIEWVEWTYSSDQAEEADRVEVTFQDGSTRTFDMGVSLRQIWHEYVK